MPRRTALVVVAIAVSLTAGTAGAGQGDAPPQCRKSDRCIPPGGDGDGKERPEGKARHDIVKNSIGSLR
jgi:hypothetical protein